MANEVTAAAAAAEQEKEKLKEEKKQFKKEQKEQRKEARRRAAEIAKQEEALGEDSGNGIVTLFATLLIVVLWLAVICVIIKLDIGGFGSGVLAPILKDVPVLSSILPDSPSSALNPEDVDEYGGYASIEDAVDYIRQLELQLEREQTASKAKDTDLELARAEILRLREFEERQQEFQRIKTEFYERVVSELGPEEYRAYFESMDPTTAEYIYRQVVIQLEESAEVKAFAERYSAMKPKNAAAIFETMTDDLELVTKILRAMSSDDSGAILAAMDAELAGRLTKMLDPDT